MLRYTAILLFAFCFYSCSNNSSKDPGVLVTLELLADNVSESENVFVSGNHVSLGSWNPGEVKLKKETANKWELKFSVPPGTHLEYKFTKGSWDSEALLPDASIPSNYKFKARKDTAVKHQVANWKQSADSENADVADNITGNVVVHSAYKTPGLDSRDIIVWLPPSYEKTLDAKYPVLYMHDGQNVFNPKTAFTGYDWRADETTDSLIKTNSIEEIIIVAIYNTAARTNEYSYLEEGRKYVSFLINDLKPFVDSAYRTKPDPQNTAVIGSSMGGLISFIIVWEHSNVFSKAACLSPAFNIPKYQMNYVPFVSNDSSDKRSILVYIDNGGVGLEKELQPGIDQMMKALDEKGYTYKFLLESDAEHNEKAWAKRLKIPIYYLFGKAS